MISWHREPYVLRFFATTTTKTTSTIIIIIIITSTITTNTTTAAIWSRREVCQRSGFQPPECLFLLLIIIFILATDYYVLSLKETVEAASGEVSRLIKHFAEECLGGKFSNFQKDDTDKVVNMRRR